MNNKKLEKELEPKFKNIKNAKKTLDKNDVRKVLFKLQRERSNEKHDDINLEIENYLSENKVYDKKEYEKLNGLKNKSKHKEKIDKLKSIIDSYSKMVQTELQDIKVNYNLPILSICNSKIVEMRNMLQSYSNLLNKLIVFKDKTNDIKGKLPKAKIEDEFILEIIDEINTLLNGYNAIAGISYKRVN